MIQLTIQTEVNLSLSLVLDLNYAINIETMINDAGGDAIVDNGTVW